MSDTIDSCVLTGMIFSYFFQIMSEYDQTFDPNILIGHCDLISRFSDFPLYLGTQLVYGHTAFRICMSMTRPLTVKYSRVRASGRHRRHLRRFLFFGS